MEERAHEDKNAGGYAAHTAALNKNATFVVPTGCHELYITSLFFPTEVLPSSSFHICGHCSAKSLSHLDTEE